MTQREVLTLTTSSGAASENARELHGRLGFIVCIPTTSTGAFDITITDEKSVVIYSRSGQVGALRDQVSIPIKGVLTIALANADNDEDHTLELLVEDHY